MAIVYNQPTAPAQTQQESFLQRQQRVYGTPQPAQSSTQPPAQQSATSPVSSTGRITADQTPTYQAGTQSGSTYKAGSIQAPASGWATYQPTQQAPQAQPYSPGPQGTYQAQQIQQFQAPNQQQLDAQGQGLVSGMLANPYSMNQQVVDQMKGAQTEQALAMQKQMLGQLGSNAASRGIDPSVGYGQMMQRQAMQDTMGQILAGNREIDIKKAQTDRQDLLNALNAASGWQNSNLGRAVSAYQTQLQGLGAQKDEYLSQIGTENDAAKLGMAAQQQGFADALAAAQFGADQSYRGYQSVADAQQRAMQAGLSNEGLMQQAAQLGLGNKQADQQMSQFLQSLGFDKEKFAYAKEQDAAQLAAQQAAASAAEDRWADQQAMMIQQQEMEQYNALLRAILGGE